MRNYSAETYKELVADIDDETLQRFMDEEQAFIAGVPDAKNRTFVDLGAGYGRVEPFLSGVAQNVIAVEINPEMYKGLEQLALQLPNLTPVQGDFLQLPDLVPDGAARPVFMILQNSLGTIEGGTAEQVVEVVVQEARKRQGSFILSLLRQPALRGWGVEMYGKLQPMVGNVDLEKSDFEEGMMVTDTGYTSKWWTDIDIERFRSLGNVVREQTTAEYELLQLDFEE